jgi:PPE-repeat protein
MRYTTLSAVVLASLAVAACGGDSKEEAAKNTVCNARADISKQVDQLKGMTASTFTTSAASKSLSEIRSSLSDIKNAQSDLADDRRAAVEQANQKFAGQVQDVVKQVFRSTSAADAKTQLTTAFQQLADTYQQTYARIDCS